MDEVITVYTRKNEPAQMQHVFGNLYKKLDGNPKSIGAIVNLKTALECRLYFKKPIEKKREKNER